MISHDRRSYHQSGITIASNPLPAPGEVLRRTVTSHYDSIGLGYNPSLGFSPIQLQRP